MDEQDVDTEKEQGPLVTVVIPTYNRAHLVSKAIVNACDQSYPNLEIVVVDDGSSDDTAAVVKAVDDPRVKYIRHARNKGLPAARNTGIRAARGEYLAFLDDDDAWDKRKIAKQLRVIQGVDACLTAAISNGRLLRRHHKTIVSLDDLRRGSFDPSSLMAKTSVLREVLFDENLRQGEDWDAFIRIAQRYTIGWLAEPLLFYNAGTHARMTNEAKVLAGPELERRTAMLHKHRSFFGEKWFRRHCAEAFLGFIGTRRNKLGCIGYAVERCGVTPVARVLVHKVYRRLFPGAVMGEGLRALFRRPMGAETGSPLTAAVVANRSSVRS